MTTMYSSYVQPASTRSTEALQIKKKIWITYYYKELKYLQTDILSVKNKVLQNESYAKTHVANMNTKYDAMNKDWNNYSKTSKILLHKSKLNSYLNSCSTNADYVISYAKNVLSYCNSSTNLTSSVSSQQSEAKAAYTYIRKNASTSSTEFQNCGTPYNAINTNVSAINSSLSTQSTSKSRANTNSNAATNMKTKVAEAKKTVSKIIL